MSVAAALDLWDTEPDARHGGLLKHLAAKAIKGSRQKPSQMPRSARGDKARGWLTLGDDLDPQRPTQGPKLTALPGLSTVEGEIA